MISHKHKFIFIHIPKCAGITIQKILGNKNIATVRLDHHGRLSEYLNKYGENVIESYFKFAVVRNPWDLEVSSYFFNRSLDMKNTKNNSWIWVKEKINFVHKKHSSIQIDTNNLYWLDLIYFCKNHSFEQYVKSDFWFSDGTYEDFLEINGELKMDYLIQFEDLQNGFDSVCNRLKIPRKKLPHYNKSKRRHYSVYYTEETKQIVANKYRQAIEEFGYQFEQERSTKSVQV